jgi:hypothetical protein
MNAKKLPTAPRGIDEAREQGTLFRHVSLSPRHLFFVTNQSRSVYSERPKSPLSMHMPFPQMFSVKI